MKKKLPKILTLKRIVFLSVILVAAIVLVVYFVGGYKGILPTYSAKDFTLDGFTSYTELEAPHKEKANELANGVPYKDTDDDDTKIESCLHKGHFDVLIGEYNQSIQDIKVNSYKEIVGISKDVILSKEAREVIVEYLYYAWEELDNERLVSMYEDLIKDYIKECVASIKKLDDVKDLTDEDLALVDKIYDEISAGDITLEMVKAFCAAKNDTGEIKNLEAARSLAESKRREAPTKEEFIKSYIQKALGYEGKEPVMENGNYAFYFDKKWTTFKVVDKKTGNVWYSNPQEKEDFNNSSSVLDQQKSLLNIYYAGGLGGTTMWNSYTYAISDTDSSGEKELTPNFKIKEVKDGDKVTAVQVYYFFEQRNIDYVYFPKFISSTKVKDPADLDLSKYEELPELYTRNQTNTTDGAWEEVASMKSALGGGSVKASDNTVWFAGNGVPSLDLGYNGTYYIDVDTADIYVRTNKETYDSGQNGLVSKEVEEYWKKINTTELVWETYAEKNYTYNNTVNKATVFEYAYSGNGAPIAEEGLNGFYYYDASNNTLYKKNNGTLDYNYVLSMKEMVSLCRTIYGLEDAESESNTRGYDYFSLNNKYEGMALGIREKLYSYLYEKCLYTEEDLVADNGEFSVETVSTKGKFGIAMEYTLNEDGLQVSILDNSISELADFPLTTVEILPYFTSAHYSKEGYMVIPDGSGAVMNYNNGKTKYVQYAKSVYTTDLSKMAEIKATELEDLMFPMYGIVNTHIPGNDGIGSGALVEAVSGTSQLRISANVSYVSDSYNKIFFSAFYRESQKTTIGVGYYATTYTKWTEERIHNDITINYNFLKDDELNYSAIAKKYREILIDRFGLVEKDTTDEVVLDVSLVGVYDFRNNFLGISYRDYDTMTTFAQAEKVLEELKAHGANHINAYYLGWRKKGLIDTSFENMSYSSLLGSKKDLASLKEYSEANDIDLYMDVNFGELNNYQESFGQSRYSTRDVSGAYVKKYPYDLSSNVYDKKQRATYVLSPRFYGVFMENLAEGYKDKVGLSNISIKNLGSSLASDYKRHNEIFKHTALEESKKALGYAQSSGISNITLYNPYDYAFAYTSNALEVSYEATQYEIFDYSIPFYQLVVNGLFDYSGEVINAHDEKGEQWHLMHILESGSNVAFTFSYEDSSKLIQTDYKNYYYTQYNKWTSDVADMLKIIDEIGIHDAELTSHERVANKVYKVTYTGNTNVEIILNYSDSVVKVEGKNVEPKNFVYNKNNTGWWAYEG